LLKFFFKSLNFILFKAGMAFLLKQVVNNFTLKPKNMFDQVLQMVKDHMNSNPQVSGAIPNEQADDVHNEIATHITEGLKNQASAQGGAGGLLSSLEGGLTSGSPVVSAIEGGLVSSLGSKFGLPPMATGAISAALPGLLQKFAHKANDPNDASVSKESLSNELQGAGSTGGLGSLFW
jgi:hypothetical protein